ncbi:MAG: [protein-PII] uridylyltransferase [Verrucomicrobiaceae bacterium]|nr:MAG: [protein-PII] uridylyltransferase [Verrucomicrobiaceae bacterium]
MPVRHLEKVRAHAQVALIHEPDQVQAERIKKYRSFLKKEEHRIRLQHKAGESGEAICAQRATLLDVVLHNLFASSLEKTAAEVRVALVATGGYGRGLLNPGSDVDLLFLHPERGGRELSSRTRDVIEKVLYMLWDVGFKIGHAVRTMKETYAQANSDHQTKTALIESRFITGDQALFDQFSGGFRRQCIDGRAKEFLEFRAQDLKERHSKQSNTVYLQEPHLKNGCGGLRDYHNILWCAYVKLGVRTVPELIQGNIFSRIAGQEIIKAHEFLLRVRNDLHYSEKRPTDILTLRAQGVVATNLGYAGRRIVQRCEAFMRDYYHHARNLYQHNLSLMERFELEQVEEKNGIFSFLALRKGRKRESFDGFYSQDGFIFPENDNIFEEDSTRMMRLFQHLQLRRLKLSPKIRQLFKASYGVIGRTFRYRKANRETFEAILSRKGEVGGTLRQMHRVGFLGRYLPEFGELTDLVQHEFFHRYTADEHTLKCLERLDELSDNNERKLGFHQKLFHDLEDPAVLYLALIMHDTGRAENVRKHAYASTELADQVCRRLQIVDSRRSLLLFLVDNHLLFWHTATTKNLDDPEVIAGFARIVRHRAWLDVLFLHTYADSRATNEAGWTDWKESLVRQLYTATAAYFQDQEAFRHQLPVSELRKSVASLLDDSYSLEIDALLANMPERYTAFRSAQDIALHVRAFRSFFRQQRKEDPRSALTPVVKWIAHPEQGSSSMILCSWDRHMLLSKVAGALASHSINILHADFFLRSDNLVLDLLRVCTTNFEPVTSEAATKAVGELIARSCNGEEIDYGALIRKRNREEPEPLPGWHSEFPMRVIVSNERHRAYTIVEIQAVDRIGLLYDIFTAIGSLNLEITHARINTEKGAAIDSFCVTDVTGSKIADPELLHRLRLAVEAAVIVPSP